MVTYHVVRPCHLWAERDKEVLQYSLSSVVITQKSLKTSGNAYDIKRWPRYIRIHRLHPRRRFQIQVTESPTKNSLLRDPTDVKCNFRSLWVLWIPTAFLRFRCIKLTCARRRLFVPYFRNSSFSDSELEVPHVHYHNELLKRKISIAQANIALFIKFPT